MIKSTVTDITLQEIQQQIDTCSEALAEVQKRLKGAPVGELISKKIRGNIRFYKRIPLESGEKIIKYIPQSNHIEIVALTNKRYCEALGTDLEAEINVLEKFKINYNSEKKYQDIKLIPPALRSEVEPIFVPVEEQARAWQAKPFIANSKPIDEKNKYITSRNETVRSRMEYIIADALAARGIAYHYEEQLTLCDRTIYPDFTIMHPTTGEIYYLEFFGMMNDPAYSEKAMTKVRLFQYSGLSKYFIAIFESNALPFQSTTLNVILDSYFGKN